MIKYTKLFITLLLAVIAFEAKSQSTATTSSPYSRYGLGDLSPAILPQNIGMGGIATATNEIGNFSNINPLNPASYGVIDLTTIDVGLYASTIFLNQTGQPSQTNGNFRLSHLAFGIPVTHNSALSFGLLPYSSLGYNYKQTSAKGFGTGTSTDTSTVNYIYSGEGSLSKAYIGYGITIQKHLLLGFNASYIFGDLKHYQSTEIPTLPGTLNSRIEQDNSVGGVTYDYGAQYIWDLSLTRHIVFGYSASAKANINSKSTYLVSQYSFDASGNPNIAADTLVNQKNAIAKILIPQVNHFGISYQKDQNYLFGIDYSIGNWSALSIGGVNQGMADSKTLNLGGQYTPNINALGSYWSTVDYRLGFIHDQSYVNVPNPTGTGNTQIQSNSVTFGFGLPLRPDNVSYYKLNLTFELGQRGSLNNGLVKENFINFHLSFLLNEKWFQRYQFD
jgi:hypothetical protein